MSTKHVEQPMENSQDVEQYLTTYSQNRNHPFKIILSFFKGKIPDLIKSVFIIICKILPVWMLPIVTSNIINIATSPEENKASTILYNALFLFVFFLGNILATYGFARVFHRLTRSIEGNLRSTLVRKLQQLSIGFHNHTQSGKLQSKIMRDVENIVVFLNQGFLSIIEITLSTIVAITVTLNKSPIVFLFFIVAIPVAVLAVYKFKKPLANRNSEYRHEMENTQAAVGEMLDMIPITRAHGLQDMEEDKITSKIKQVVNKGYSLDKLNSLFGSTTWATFQTFQLICLAFTGFLAYKKLITVGEVILYQTYYAQIVNQISALISMYPNISKGIESVNSIGEILAATDIENSGDIIPIGKVDGSVEFDDVCYKYPDGDRWVLENLSFKAKSGESIAFVGDSGSGKSTVLNLLIGFARPQSGRILIDRINMANLNLHEYRSQIAVVPQNTILFTGTIRDNISYGMDSVTDADVNQVIEEVGLDDMLENMPNGIYSILNENGANLSGGQRQRISIARALIRKPKIIIFDEATSALDSVSEKKVQAATEKMMQKCTTFMVAHRLSTIRNADKIAVFENGKICEIGGYDELMEKRGKFYNLKKLQE